MVKPQFERYLSALNDGDLSSVISLFEPDAIVVSPLYGAKPVEIFFTELFDDTARSSTTLLNVFEPTEGGKAAALHFNYIWTLASGKVVEFEVVDVFELSDDRRRFAKLKIIYDTAPLKVDFEAVQLLVST